MQVLIKLSDKILIKMGFLLKSSKNNKTAVKVIKEQSAKSITALKKEITSITKQANSFKAKEPFSNFLADFKSARSK